MSRKLAYILSVVFHPLLWTTYIFLGLFYLPSPLIVFSNPEVRDILIQALFIFTFLLPSVAIWMIYRLGWVSSLSMELRQERLVPFFVVCLIYAAVTFGASYLSVKWGIDSQIPIILLAITFSLSLLIVFTYFIKISAHTLAAGGTLGGILALASRTGDTTLLIPVCITALITGVVASARLTLQAHTPREVWLGGLVGFFVNFMVIYGEDFLF